MRRSMIVLAGLVVLIGYARRRSDSEPIDTERRTTREMTAPAATLAQAPRPTMAPSPPVETRPKPVELFEVFDLGEEPPLAPAPPRAIHGRLVDLEGEPCVGATVVATSPSLVGEQVVIADETGYFRIVDLPAGDYTVTIYNNNMTFVYASVGVNTDEASVVEDVLDPNDRVEIQPVVVIGEDYTRNIPIGRTFGAVLGAAAGTQVDSYGTSFVGVTSLENQYVLDDSDEVEETAEDGRQDR